MGAAGEQQRRVVLHFSVPYLTHWGQSVVVYGASAVLGGWDAKRGHALACRHEGEALIWEARVRVPAQREVGNSEDRHKCFAYWLEIAAGRRQHTQPG